MQCVNHSELEAKAFCQSCGKALCSQCVQTTPIGQVFCTACNAAFGGNPSHAYTQGIYPPPPPPPPGSPNPVVAAFLGLIPGVGAMYNGQFFKGLIHVVVFAVLISITDSYPIFGLFIAAWIFYQSFEAYHTAVARRDGLPVPDPFGLNEIGSWLNLGVSRRGPMPPPAPGPQAGRYPPPGFSATYDPGYPTADPGGQPAGYGVAGGAAAPPYSEPYTGAWPEAGPEAGPYAGTPGVPPPPALGSAQWMTGFGHRREPVGAIILIALGLLFLLQSMGFVSHILHFAWPLFLIGLGVWMIVSRMGHGQGGPK